MTLLTIIQNVSDEVGIERPTSVIGTSDQTVRQLLALSNRAGKMLAREKPWTALTTEYTFSTVANTDAYDLPTDYMYHLDDTLYDRTTMWPMGLVTPQMWQANEAMNTLLIYGNFRIRGNEFCIAPTPTSVRTIAYEYISANWCESSLGVKQSSWAADTDIGVLPEYLMELGLIMLWKKTKGLNYADDYRQYTMEVSKAYARDGGRHVINLAAGQNKAAGDAEVTGFMGVMNVDWEVAGPNWEDIL